MKLSRCWTAGIRLVAEEQHTALTRDDIAQHWQESFRTF